MVEDSYEKLKIQLAPAIKQKLAVYPTNKNVFISPPPPKELSPALRIMSYVFLLSQPKIVGGYPHPQTGELERFSTVQVEDDIVMSDLSKQLAKIYYKKSEGTETTDREQTLFALILLRYVRYWGATLDLTIYSLEDREKLYIHGQPRNQDMELDDGPEGELSADTDIYMRENDIY